MSISPTQILQQPLILLDMPAGSLRIQNGVAVIDWSAVQHPPSGSTHVDLVFDIPLFGPTHPFMGPVNLSAIAFPATFDVIGNTPSTKAIGWGVTNTIAIWDPLPQTAKLTIKLIAKSDFVEVVRVGYQVTAAFQTNES